MGLNLSIQFLKKIIRLFGPQRAAQISARIVESLEPTLTITTPFGPLIFFCPSTLTEWRTNTLLTKEPDTIAWITSFVETDVLWDIGANVGVYSLFAALKGHNVLAFEPAPGNYYLLNKNIELNHLDEKLSAYCIAFHDTSKLDRFFMQNTELGCALNSFGEALDWQGTPFAPSLKQAMIGFSLDGFIESFRPPFPNHLKLDVDGNEGKIIQGAKKTLSDPRLKSILVELDPSRPDYINHIISTLSHAGLSPAPSLSTSNDSLATADSNLNHIFIRHG